MVSFRRIILAMAVLALFTGLASAQVIVGPVGGSSAGNFICTANVANPTQARSEGYAELTGDITLVCTGGSTVPTFGSPVPTANITVALNNTLVTSRVFSSNGASEALLLIDEPGSATATGAGTTATQTICPSSNFGAGLGGCQMVVSSVGGNTVATVAGTSTSYNVFQGLVRGNTVVFNGVPILAPVTQGLARVFRITNVRANAAQFAGQAGTFQGQIPILASIAISNGPQLQNSLLTTAYLYNGLGTTSIRNSNNTSGTSDITNLAQCGTAGITSGAVLRFPEGFAAAFKTRVNPTSTYSGAATVGGGPGGITSFSQNFPGQFSPGSESGFIFAANGGTAGLADFGTRLKATFNNVPSGINIFVSTSNVVGNNPGVNIPGGGFTQDNAHLNSVPAGNVTTLLAGLVLSETATAGQGGFLPLASATNNNSGVNLFGPLPVDANGTATAVWEILTTNPNAFETAEFAVFYSYTGNPATNTPPTSPAGTVSMSFAPTFSTPTASSLIPRFTPPSTSSSLVSVVLCQTTLLYPFVNATAGFDTGLAIANTSADPFGTKTQTGKCRLNFFGTAAGTTTFQDTPTIAPGTVWADQTTNIRNGFSGYVIAVCDFQLAHGYALFSDTGIRNWATGYLALVLSTGSGDRNTNHIAYAPATGGVEGGIH